MPTDNTFVSHAHLYSKPHADDPFWGVGWMRPEDYFCDVTPEQDAEYQRWWDGNSEIDISRTRMSGWPGVLDEVSRVAAMFGAPGPVEPRVQPQISGKLAVGWTSGGRVWICMNAEAPTLVDWLAGVARVEMDFRAGTRRISRGR